MRALWKFRPKNLALSAEILDETGSGGWIMAFRPRNRALRVDSLDERF